MRVTSFGLRCLVVAALVASSALTWAQAMTSEQKKTVLDGMNETITKSAFVPGVDFSKWPEFLGRHQEAIDKAEDVNQFSAAVNRALREFGFSHIRLLTPRANTNRRTTTRKGIGITATPAQDGGLQVRAMAESGPAKEAGLEIGDIILTVNGAKAEKAEQLEGELGEKRALEIKKANGETKNLEVEIKNFSSVRKETLTWVDEETAVLRVFTFANGYDRNNIEALVKEANGKAKRLIIDLRSNGGGAVVNMNHLISLMIPANTEYGTFVNRKMANDWQAANPDAQIEVAAIGAWAPNKYKTRQVKDFKPFDGKIAVLINRGSGSASEITACALREKGGAILVGTRSAGAVLASVYGPLKEGFALQYPVSDYVSINGTRLEANPLKPDVEVTASEPGKDLVVERAVEALKSAEIVKKAS